MAQKNQKSKEEAAPQKLAVIRVRGSLKKKAQVEIAFRTLNLLHNNWCVVVDGTPTVNGSLAKIKDFVTWGEIDEPTYKALFEKKAELYLGKETDTKGKISYKRYLVADNKKYKRYFRLNPPRGGFGRAGIKTQFENKGALGYRGQAINALVMKMI